MIKYYIKVLKAERSLLKMRLYSSDRKYMLTVLSTVTAIVMLVFCFAFSSFASGTVTPDSDSSIEIHRTREYGNYILGLKAEENRLSDFKAEFSESENLVITAERNSVVLGDSSYLGTGCVVNFSDSVNSVNEAASIVLHGDVDGDGAIDAFDLFLIDKAQND